MPRVWVETLVAVLLAVTSVSSAWAGETETGLSGGLMQQPTSNYYHATYGMTVGWQTDDGAFSLQGSYLERPEFRSGGFVDKEYGYFLLFGNRVFEDGGHRVVAYFGPGQMEGYLKETADRNQDGVKEIRTFRTPGPVAAVEYAYRWEQFKSTVQHKTLVGYGGPEQTEAYVAWPYNFYELRLSWLF